MKVKVLGGDSFSFLRFVLNKGDKLVTESDAMTSMDTDLEVKTKFNGGLFKALLLKFLGKETLFRNTFINRGDTPQRLIISQPVPGQIQQVKLEGKPLLLQAGAFICCTSGVKMKLRWAGFASFFAREGLFRLELAGKGYVWYGAFGSIVEKEVNGEYIVDSGHLLSYPKNMKLGLKLAGGIFSSFFSGEGVVLKLSGTGKVQLQTRSLGGLAGWLNPKFW